MTARYGYHGIEPFQEDVDKPPEKLKEALDASDIALCTVGSGGQYLDPPQASGDNREQRLPGPLRFSFRLQAPRFTR
jgi:hypothetical protein